MRAELTGGLILVFVALTMTTGGIHAQAEAIPPFQMDSCQRIDPSPRELQLDGALRALGELWVQRVACSTTYLGVGAAVSQVSARCTLNHHQDDAAANIAFRGLCTQSDFLGNLVYSCLVYAPQDGFRRWSCHTEIITAAYPEEASRLMWQDHTFEALPLLATGQR